MNPDIGAMLHTKRVCAIPADVIQRLIRLYERFFVRNVPHEQVQRLAELDGCLVWPCLGAVHALVK
jgi:hypothetical protein